MWLSLVTDVDLATARNLVDSMNNEVVVQDDRITDLLPGELMGYDDAVRLALAERAKEKQDEKSAEDDDQAAARAKASEQARPDHDAAAR